MLPTFQRAMQRRSIRIAGVRLGPLTLAQAYCLHAWESPLVQGGDVTPADFALALWTCSRPCWPFHRFCDAVVRGRPERTLARWGRRYDLRRLTEDVATLRLWVSWHCKLPPRFLKESGASRGAAAPWPLVVAVQVMPILGERRTWTAPVPEVLAYKIALDNAQGDTSWKSEEEEAQGYMTDGCRTQSDS